MTTPDRPDLNDDDVLLDELRRALADADPVPGAGRATAVSAFDLGRVDEELAELVFDSLLDQPEVAMRHSGVLEARSIGFLAGGLRLDLELVDDDDDGLLLGQIEPAASAAVVLERVDGQQHTEADDLGRFQLEAARGTARLRITLPDGAVVVTPWITW